MRGPIGEAPDDPDEIDRRLQEITAELAGPAKFTEPSAAERAHAHVKASQRMGWRNARKAKRLRKPVQESRTPRKSRRQRARPAEPAAPWRPAPAGPGHERARSVLMAVLVMVVLAAALSGITYGVSIFLHRSPGGALIDQTPVTNGPVPRSQPSTNSLPTPGVNDPFAGSPAETFANSAAGITIPHTHRVHGYSAAQVATAYRMTKRLLVAANLNMATLRGRSPNAFTRLLIAPQQSYFDNHLDKVGLTAGGDARSTRDWVTSFAPGSTELAGHVIKVHGSMHATAGRNGQYQTLRIQVDYLFIYPVERPAQPSTLMRIVVRDDVYVDFAAYTDPGGPLQPWWEVMGGGASGARCDVNDGFIHPQFSNGSPDRVQPSGAPINPYDLNTPPNHHGCRATTGT